MVRPSREEVRASKLNSCADPDFYEMSKIDPLPEVSQVTNCTTAFTRSSGRVNLPKLRTKIEQEYSSLIETNGVNSNSRIGCQNTQALGTSQSFVQDYLSLIRPSGHSIKRIANSSSNLNSTRLLAGCRDLREDRVLSSVRWLYSLRNPHVHFSTRRSLFEENLLINRRNNDILNMMTLTRTAGF